MLQLTKPLLGKPELDAVERVLASGWLAEGNETEQFERVIAKYVHSKHAVAVCNCTVALELCLRAYGVKGKVAVPDFTHPATAQAVLNAGCTPVLYDVAPETFTLTGVNNSIDASMPVSWAGNPIINYPRSLIIEDAACALGSSHMGKMTGSEFTSCFSLHPRKLITCGEGAVITSNDDRIIEEVRSLKNFGRAGGNYRFNDVSAAIGAAQLSRLEWLISCRVEMAQIYRELLRNVKGVKTPAIIKGARQTWQTFAAQLETANRDSVIQKLKAKGIEAQRGAYALHLLPQFRNLKRAGKLENATILHNKLLALPMAYDLTEEDQRRVVEELKIAIQD